MQRTLGAAGNPAPVERTALFARQLLDRWGIVFRDLLARETLASPWRELLIELRRMEAKGKFAAVVSSVDFRVSNSHDRSRGSVARNASKDRSIPLRIAAADPLNLAGIIIPGPHQPLAASRWNCRSPEIHGQSRRDPVAPGQAAGRFGGELWFGGIEAPFRQKP